MVTQQSNPALPASTDNYLPELLQASIEDYVQLVDRTPAVCGSPEQQAQLSRLIADGNQLVKLIAAERMKLTKTLDDQKAAWIAKERSLTEPITQAQARIKLSVHQYNQEVVRIRQQQIADEKAQLAQTIEEEGEANWLTAAAPIAAKPRGVREVWTHRITDAGQVPAEYLTVDTAKVKQAIASGVRSIPGIEIFQETQTSFRS